MAGEDAESVLVFSKEVTLKASCYMLADSWHSAEQTFLKSLETTLAY